MLGRLWHDDAASVMSAEIILLATILVVGIVVGAKSFRDAAVTEWGDFAQAIGNLDQSYNIPDRVDPTTGETIWGSHFIDEHDFCDTAATGGSPAYGGSWTTGFTPYFQSTTWTPPTLTVAPTGERP